MFTAVGIILGAWLVYDGLCKVAESIRALTLSQPEKDQRRCMYQSVIGGAICGYTEADCMHEGSTLPGPPRGRHVYQPEKGDKGDSNG